MRAFTPRGMKATRKKTPSLHADERNQLPPNVSTESWPSSILFYDHPSRKLLSENSQDEEGRIVHAQRSPRLEDFIAGIKGDEKWQFEKLVRAQ